MRRAAAFSLIEIMCALLILGVGLAGLTHGISTALSASKEAERQTAAALLAAGRIEELRAEGYLTDGEDEGEGDGDLSRYHWKQTIRSAAVDGLHEVEVTVEDSNSGQPIYELRTLLFEPPALTAEDSAAFRKERERARRRRP